MPALTAFLNHGLFGATDFALLIARATLGTFFILARFRWIFDPSRPEDMWFNKARRDHLIWKLCTCGYYNHPVLAGFVALVEIFGGLAVLFGLLAPLAAMGLLSVLCFATYCTAREKVTRQSPVDTVDYASCYLWTVEPLYMMLCVVVITCGAGAYSFDHVLTGLLS